MTAKKRERGGLLAVVSGPSGVGKGTVVRRLLEQIEESTVSISVTTRAPRAGERDGVEYHFVTDERFDELVAAGELLEHATYAANRYGTPRGPLEAQIAAGLCVLLEIEVQGAMQVREADHDALLLFLAPPDAEELERRLRSRATEDEATVARRLAAARDELDQRFAFAHVIVTDARADCVKELLELIRRARARG
ncbi:MAG: guanylate kinase [Glaciecola sp.]